MILVNKSTHISEIGGKALQLFNLKIKNTPKLMVVPASFFDRANKDKSVIEELKKELTNRLKKGRKYAVRSSAIDEDSENASFAGVHETFLNVEKEDVLEKVFKVYDSVFSTRAIEYRKAKGLLMDRIKIAVIIQEMVDADYAGVVFTINPITDNPDEIVISATKGLGDKLVDGTVSGTTYIVNNGEIKVLGENILNSKQIKLLLKMVYKVSQKTRRFQDIEFAIKGNKVYFLQARAIATYANIDSHNRTLVIDNANIIESYFGVTSLLTYTFAKDVYKDVYTETLKLGKVRKGILKALESSLSQMLYSHEGKIYYNMNSWYHVNSIFPSKKSASFMEGMMGVKSKLGQFKKVKMNLLDMVKLGVQFFKKLKNLDDLSNAFIENFNRIVLPYYGKEIVGTNNELYNIFKSIERDVVKEFTTPIINDCAVMFYFGLLKEKAKKHNIGQEKLNEYISNQGDVESVGSAIELVKIVDAIKENKDIKEDFITLSATELANKYRQDTVISNLLQTYRLTYGSRVRDELKLESVTMIEDETLLYELLKENILIEVKPTTYKNTSLPTKLKGLVEKTKKHIKNRERLRLYRTYVYSVVRNIFLAYGKNYLQQGRLDDARDVFYLTKQEVFSGKGDFKTLVKERKIQEKEYFAKPTYNRVVFYGNEILNVKSAENGKGLKGIPSGNGVVKARVSKMENPKDKLKEGNIILTKRTDPGWISLFPKAGGLIVEHGSMLSHSFVVARELNLPAVVGVELATTLIEDNALVTLDGLKGEITIED